MTRTIREDSLSRCACLIAGFQNKLIWAVQHALLLVLGATQAVLQVLLVVSLISLTSLTLLMSLLTLIGCDRLQEVMHMCDEQAELFDGFGWLASRLEWTVTYAGKPCPITA